MILIYIAKKGLCTHLCNCILLSFAPKSSTSSINSSHVKPRKANLILPLKCQGQSYVIISYISWQKASKLSMKSYVLEFFHV